MRLSRISGTIILILLSAAAMASAQATTEKPPPSAPPESTAADTIADPAAETPPSLPVTPEAAGVRRRDEVRVTVERLNARARPGTSYEVVAKVTRDDILTVVGQQGEWLEILPPPGTAAWCSEKFIDAQGRVIGHNVRVRSGPGVVFSAYATLPEDAAVTLVGEPVGQWRQIEAPPDATVWIHGQFVEPVTPPAADTDAAGDTPASSSDEAEAPDTAEAPIPKPPVSDGTAGDGEDTTAGESAKPLESLTDSKTDAETAKAGEDTALLPPVIMPPEGGDASGGTAPVVLSPPLPEGKTGTTIVSVEPPATEAVGTEAPDGDDVPSLNDEPTENEALKSQTRMREGTLMSLKSKATAFVSHALVRREGDNTYLLCYLISDAIDLTEWENRRVRIYGKPLDYPGWKTEALNATGIHLLLP
ncbi:MAG: SH3 domain-containing protein [Lentisphaeria bacterium]|nr:SH3 domain-containing protein [Lentisphaeria bacterium]